MPKGPRRPEAVLYTLMLLLVGAEISARPAQAHTKWMDPAPRDQVTGYKPQAPPGGGFVLPCGVNRTMAQPVTTLPSGAMQTVKWLETITHPGCFLIEFSASDTGPSSPFQQL